MPINEEPDFTPEAQRRWNEIPKEAQERILNNVWCGGCLGSAQMNLQSGEMKKDLLVLKGTCKICGKILLEWLNQRADEKRVEG